MGMFYNGANCDIYIGKGAGKKLLNDIKNARKSIRIVSPYLSPFLITELINFRKRNLEVEKREKWKDISKILAYFGFGLLAILIGVVYYLKDIKVAFGLIPIFIIFLVVKLYKNKIKKKLIYSYWY